jgi:tetratricopeptide (TPR) repeat protein
MGDLPRVASLLNKQGYLPMAQGTGGFEQAAEHYANGLILARQIGYQSLASNILRNIGHMEICRGDYGQAQLALSEAISLSREMAGILNLGTALHYEGEWYMQQGDFVPAAARFHEAEAIMQPVGLAHFRVKARSDLGLLHHLRGDDLTAETVLTEALGMATQHGDTRYEAQINVRLGYVREAQDRLDEARQAYALGVGLHRQMEQPYYAALGMAGLARLHQWAGEEAQAQDMARQIWRILDSQIPEATIESARTFATCCHILRDVDAPLADLLATRGHAQLIHRAATMDDPARRTLFWQIPDHQAVLACQPSS